MAANGKAPGVIGRAAAKIDAAVLHLSTDYVFDGGGDRAWTEADPTVPIGIYGKTKLAGEEALASSGACYATLRTAWVYSPFGNNFVRTMLHLAETRDEINVVADQYGNPTCAFDIADALMTVVNRWRIAPAHGANAIYHFAGRGTTNWADFARAIFTESAKRGGADCKVAEIATADYPTKAARPANSRLDCAQFEKMFGYSAPKWDCSLADTLKRMI